MQRVRNLWLGCSLLALTTVLAQDDADEVKEVEIRDGPPPSEEACFNVRDVRSFDALDDEHVYVRVRRNDHYVLTMVPGCIGLRDSFRIAISNDFSRVCSNSFATVTYRGLTGPETCRIRTVESVEDKEAAQALVASRRRARDR
ncbi:MAG TPA: DUF6491 family protein [Gammaproteobacteria bacterium]